MQLLEQNTGITQKLNKHGIHEPKLTKLLQKLVQPNWNCINVGANLGYFTLLLSKLAYNGTIYSIEPHPNNYNILANNILINDVSNVILDQIALSNTNAETLFYQDIKDESRSSLMNQKKRDCQPIFVKTQTLATYIQNHNITNVDLIVMDVEGAELLILSEYFQIEPLVIPRYLIIEVHGDLDFTWLLKYYKLKDKLKPPHFLWEVRNA